MGINRTQTLSHNYYQRGSYHWHRHYHSDDITTKRPISTTTVKKIVRKTFKGQNASHVAVNNFELKCLHWKNYTANIAKKLTTFSLETEELNISSITLWNKFRLRQRKCRWIYYTLRKNKNNITRMALQCNPQGSRNRGRPRNTWRCTITQELRQNNLIGEEAKITAANHIRFRCFAK